MVIALLGAVLPVLAEERPESRREIKIHADRMDYDETRKQVRLIGHVRIESGDTVMTAPYAWYHTESLVAEFQGGVRIAQPGSTLVGNRMKVWYGEQRALLNGNVRMLTEKAPGGDRRTPAVLTCAELEYSWVKGLGEARGQVRVRQGNRRAFSDQARYDRGAQTIDLAGGRFLIEESGRGPEPTPDPTLPSPEVLEPEIPLAPVQAASPPGLPGLDP